MTDSPDEDSPSLHVPAEELFGRRSGYKPMAAAPDAAIYSPVFSFADVPAPPKVDLRPFLTPIDDQGDTSSCVAHAVAGAYDYWLKKSEQSDQAVSRMFIYYNARARDNEQDKDDGSVIQYAMESLKSFGTCPEEEWPFDTDLLFEKPHDDIYKEAAPYRVQDMEQAPLDLDLWRHALAEGKPIVFGCLLYKSFDDCDQRGGVVPMPSPKDLTRKEHSSHSMCVVGYNDAEKVFIVRNSWGTDFGDQGYCYMPYAYLMNPKLNDGDCWVFKPDIALPPQQETWAHDDEPVTNGGQGVDFDIETYSVEDYAHIAIDLFVLMRKAFAENPSTDEVSGYADLAKQDLSREIGKLDVNGLVGTLLDKIGLGGEEKA